MGVTVDQTECKILSRTVMKYERNRDSAWTSQFSNDNQRKRQHQQTRQEGLLTHVEKSPIIGSLTLRLKAFSPSSQGKGHSETIEQSYTNSNIR